MNVEYSVCPDFCFREYSMYEAAKDFNRVVPFFSPVRHIPTKRPSEESKTPN